MSSFNPSLNPLAFPFSFPKNSIFIDPIVQALRQLRQWNFSTRGQELVLNLLKEWYSNKSLNSVLSQWGNSNPITSNSVRMPLKIMCYNVQGWSSRAPEVIELVYKTESSICIFTEVGELWNTNKLPHFNIFYPKGTNRRGGVSIAVGKHLKASHIETDIPNTVVLDIIGLSEPVRIIGIYWTNSQQRNLDDILPFLTEGTIVSGDFNATVKEWDSPLTDKRGLYVKEWIHENNLRYIPSISHLSKRSLRHIDLSFLNIPVISCETVLFGSSDHWPLALTCENIFFNSKGSFPHTNWKAFEAILIFLQTFWVEEQKRTKINEWYCQYVRFLAAVKNRVITWLANNMEAEREI